MKTDWIMKYLPAMEKELKRCLDWHRVSGEKKTKKELSAYESGYKQGWVDAIKESHK